MKAFLLLSPTVKTKEMEVADVVQWHKILRDQNKETLRLFKLKSWEDLQIPAWASGGLCNRPASEQDDKWQGSATGAGEAPGRADVRMHVVVG